MRVLGRVGRLALTAAGLLGVTAPAAAAQITERVAVLPVVVVNGDPSNSDRMTRALAMDLARHGCEVVGEVDVRDAARAEGLVLSRPQPDVVLRRLGRRLGADMVVYARILVQGPSLGSNRLIDPDRPAMILHVLVVDSRTGQVLMANQISQDWEASDPSMREAAPESAATHGAERLLRRLYMPVSVSGQLLDAETGEPIPEVETFLRQEGAPTRVTLTDERGRFTFRSLARRPYTIDTHAPAYHNTSRSLPFNLGESRVALNLQPRPAAISGTVKDASGAPAAGREIRVETPDGSAVDTLISLEDGSFGRAGLRAARYRISTSLADGTRLDATVELRPGDLATVELTARTDPGEAPRQALGPGSEPQGTMEQR